MKVYINRLLLSAKQLMDMCNERIVEALMKIFNSRRI